MVIKREVEEGELLGGGGWALFAEVDLTCDGFGDEGLSILFEFLDLDFALLDDLIDLAGLTIEEGGDRSLLT